MRSFFKKYLPFYRASITRFFVYRVQIFFWVLHDFIVVFSQYYLWKAVYNYSSKEIIHGFKFNDMVVYILLATITNSIVRVFIIYDIAEDVKQGNIAVQLIKPINYRIKFAFEKLGELPTFFLLEGPIYIFCMLLLGIKLNLTISKVALFVISALLGAAINFTFSFIIALFSFYTTNSFGLNGFKESLVLFLSGQLLPLVFYPSWLLAVVNVLPFKHIVSTPILIMMDKVKGIELINVMGLQVIWLIAMLIILELFWQQAVKKVVVNGG